VAALLLSACGDPTADVPRLADQAIPDGAPVLDVAQDDPPQGAFLGRLLGVARSDEKAAAAAEDAPETVEDTAPDLDQEALRDARDTASHRRQGGVLGRLLGRVPKAEDAPFDSPLTGDAEAMAQERIAPGTMLPYGVVGVICDMPKGAMGRKIAQYPDTAPRHVLYDSAPDTATPRSFYLTGLTDGCARQFTAALAMFGTVRMHEKLRYGLPAEVQPYSDTDKAYETLKVRICGVDRRDPCGERVSRLEADTVFLSIYEHFGDNARWSNLLLHGGVVLAQDLKEG
jgi:hypothetical protein